MVEGYASQGFQTKMAIVSALNDLTESLSFEQVRIFQICERAEIARSTFYHHFCDKNAILQWHSFLAYEIGIDRIGRTSSWFQGHMFTTLMLESYRNLYFKAGVTQEYSGVRPWYIRHRIENLTETVTDFRGVTMTPLLDFQIRAMAATEAAMANYRYSRELHVPIEEYCRMMERTVPRELFEATEVTNAGPDPDAFKLLFGLEC